MKEATHGLITLPENIYWRFLGMSPPDLYEPPEIIGMIKSSGSCPPMPGK